MSDHTIEDLQAMYEQKFGRPVANAKKNDADWITSKLAEQTEDGIPEQSAPATPSKYSIVLGSTGSWYAVRKGEKLNNLDHFYKDRVFNRKSDAERYAQENA